MEKNSVICFILAGLIFTMTSCINSGADKNMENHDDHKQTIKQNCTVGTPEENTFTTEIKTICSNSHHAIEQTDTTFDETEIISVPENRLPDLMKDLIAFKNVMELRQTLYEPPGQLTSQIESLKQKYIYNQSQFKSMECPSIYSIDQYILFLWAIGGGLYPDRLYLFIKDNQIASYFIEESKDEMVSDPKVYLSNNRFYIADIFNGLGFDRICLRSYDLLTGKQIDDFYVDYNFYESNPSHYNNNITEIENPEDIMSYINLISETEWKILR